jgi:high-affinity iron transporter
MLPTFVIGLREGLEAAFLRQRGRLDLLRWVFVGVALAVVLCVGVGVALDVVSKDLPQKKQEGLETVVGVVAVVMVTYMVVWMKRHSRDLKGQLEGAAGSALAEGSGWALVAMAFLAVLREGFETVVFLLAAFNESNSGSSAGLGAVLGIVVAVVLGYGIYVKLNLSKFFRITGVVLVLVAAGLVLTAFHTAHEAGWLNAGQQRTLDLSSVVSPGSVRSSLLTGMLGLQPRPVLIELIGWLAYLVPVGLYVAWPAGKGPSRVLGSRLAVAGGSLALVAAVLLTVFAPSLPTNRPTTAGGGFSARVVSASGGSATVRTNQVAPASSTTPGAVADATLTRSGTATRRGVGTRVYTLAQTPGVVGLPAVLSYAELATRNGGRLPLGVRVTDASATVPVAYTSTLVLTAWIDPLTDRVVDLQWRQRVTTTAQLSVGATVIGSPVVSTAGLPAATATSSAAQARHDADAREDHRTALGIAVALSVVGALALLGGLAAGLLGRRDGNDPVIVIEDRRELIER